MWNEECEGMLPPSSIEGPQPCGEGTTRVCLRCVTVAGPAPAATIAIDSRLNHIFTINEKEINKQTTDLQCWLASSSTLSFMMIPSYNQHMPPKRLHLIPKIYQKQI